jgi:hypothetical protein
VRREGGGRRRREEGGEAAEEKIMDKNGCGGITSLKNENLFTALPP